MITPIDQIVAISGGQSTHNKAAVADQSGSMFGNVLRSVIENVKETDAEVSKKEYLMATGQLDNPAELVLAQIKSTTAVDMLVQLRNKAMDAYSELTRINL